MAAMWATTTQRAPRHE